MKTKFEETYKNLAIEIPLGLYINPNEVQEEISKYSLTPPTMRKRSFKQTDKEDIDRLRNESVEDLTQHNNAKDSLDNFLNDMVKSLKDTVEVSISSGELEGYITKLETETSTLRGKVDLKIVTEQKYKELLDNYIDFLSSNPKLCMSFIDEYMHDKDEISVTRFGINTIGMSTEQAQMIESQFIETNISNIVPSSSRSTSSSSSDSGKGKNQKQILLHPLEIELLKHTIGYLETHKVALVDIFARHDNGKIRLQENDSTMGEKLVPETHTIVLYKNSSNEYVIIDPSNTKHSQHLCSNSARIFGNDKVKLVAPTKIFQIYVSGGKETVGVGPNPDQYRDCIDIAVKLAFGLEREEGKIDPGKLADIKAVQEVTNQEAINKSLVDIPKDTSFRMKQASDNQIRNNVDILIKAINDQKQLIRKYPDLAALEDMLDTRYSVIIKKTYEYKFYTHEINELSALYSDCAILLCKSLNSKSLLLGESIDVKEDL
ncbi:MAG: hypothetical protein K0R02_36 [Rickettsiaceae bacterium]|jgi:hypothetical protein|nr:hypothetical protein [Rickettsiaceae bacterium]